MVSFVPPGAGLLSSLPLPAMTTIYSVIASEAWQSRGSNPVLTAGFAMLAVLGVVLWRQVTVEHFLNALRVDADLNPGALLLQ
jgi:hypothetical protein